MDEMVLKAKVFPTTQYRICGSSSPEVFGKTGGRTERTSQQAKDGWDGAKAEGGGERRVVWGETKQEPAGVKQTERQR